MKLLLHICCAPCLICPLEIFKEKGFKVNGFFYNPNIHPLSEYKKRRQALVDFGKTQKFEIIYPEYKPEEFFQAVNPVRNTKALRRENNISNGVNLKETKQERCSICWSLRLEKTAKTAREKEFDFFSTTLLVSPYQNQGVLKKIGSDLAEKNGIDFYYEDFRPGFKKAHALAKAQGIYCQRYCGCIYSMKPRLTEHK